jgi:hypothetical protein
MYPNKSEVTKSQTSGRTATVSINFVATMWSTLLKVVSPIVLTIVNTVLDHELNFSWLSHPTHVGIMLLVELKHNS